MVAGCVCVVLIGTFVVALVHKVRVLRSGRAVTEPVLQGPAFARRHATTLVASAARCLTRTLRRRPSGQRGRRARGGTLGGVVADPAVIGVACPRAASSSRS
jgi:hypothetical protein